VYQRDLSRGRVYDITYRMGGRKIWESGFSSLAAAQERLAEQRLASRQGALPPVRRVTLAQFVEEVYLPRQEARLAQRTLRSSSLNQYKRDLRLHIRPALGSWRIDRIDPATAQRLHDSWFADQGSWSARRIAYTLSSVFELAQRQGYIRFNPVQQIEKAPARGKRKPLILTLEQVWHLLSHATEHGIPAIVMLAAFQGLRQAEIFGLRWANVDLTEGSEGITVVEQHYRGETVDRTKTESGMRKVPLAPHVAEALRTHYVRLKLDGRPNPHDLVFPNSRGNHLHASNFTSGPWKRTRRDAGLSDLDFHDLRKFYVSHIRSQNLSTAMTMQLTGHADERVHASYTHPIPGTEDQIRQALNKAFGSPSGSTVVARDASTS
jgi:integrase